MAFLHFSSDAMASMTKAGKASVSTITEDTGTTAPTCFSTAPSFSFVNATMSASPKVSRSAHVLFSSADILSSSFLVGGVVSPTTTHSSIVASLALSRHRPDEPIT